MQKAYLILENGLVLEGRHFGAPGTVRGELVFTTGMTGCAESLTDPSYYGQIVIYTFPQFGNYGICHEDLEHDHCYLQGVVVREFCEAPSNFRCDESVNEFLKRQNVVGIAGVDTRQLTQMIRDQGVINAEITTELPLCSSEDLRSFRVSESVENTSTKKVVVLPASAPEKYSVALIDYGAKKSIADSLRARGCKVTVFPYSTSAEEILAYKPDGVMLSNGPGDPSDNLSCIEQIQKLFGKVPMFGICLGHQMMALAAGAKTKKMKFGHRGANQPVKDLKTGRVSITSQNHGYAVDLNTLSGTEGTLRYVNGNDGTCEGVDYLSLHAFSLQFHPEAHGGPLDCQDAFDRFTAMMEEW